MDFQQNTIRWRMQVGRWQKWSGMTYCCQMGRALESNSICKRKKNKKMNYVQQELEKRVVWTTCSPARLLNCYLLSLDWNSSSHSSAGGSIAVSAPKALSLVLFTSQYLQRERKWVWKTKCGPVPTSLNANLQTASRMIGLWIQLHQPSRHAVTD